MRDNGGKMPTFRAEVVHGLIHFIIRIGIRPTFAESVSMAKQQDPQQPKKSQSPAKPPIDDVDEVVEFVDEIPGPADEPVGFAFEDLPSQDAPRQPAEKGAPSDSVIDDELIRLSDGAALDSREFGGVISDAD